MLHQTAQHAPRRDFTYNDVQVCRSTRCRAHHELTSKGTAGANAPDTHQYCLKSTMQWAHNELLSPSRANRLAPDLRRHRRHFVDTGCQNRPLLASYDVSHNDFGPQSHGLGHTRAPQLLADCSIATHSSRSS